jgi:hypothetical protein
MESNWAVENLQTIRTLMERSAVYRRALAPIMLFTGLLGVLAAGGGTVFHLDSTRAFSELWLGTALVAVVGAFLIARRQALKDREPFWSPPTKRVAQALLPPLTAGLIVGVTFIFTSASHNLAPLLALLWILFYGCALHAAGFFMPRGMKMFAWLFVVGASSLLIVLSLTNIEIKFNVHELMGFFFGVLHMAYGAYLYLTENRKNAA